MPVASVVVSPASPGIGVGGTQQLSAVTKDSAGTTLTGRVVTWSSSNTSVATVTGFTLVPELKKVDGIGEVKLYDTSDGVMQDLVAGRIDMAILDPPLMQYVRQLGQEAARGGATTGGR